MSDNNTTKTRRSNEELLKLAFDNMNSFKRHRALAEDCRRSGDTTTAIFHELKQYKHIDSVELAMRAIQSALRGFDQ
ncbi:hypothetical protein BpsS140_00066 [Bacillus phage vB_BpsS-140]|nr:hypothetical protein BpsS140_00066 [Bacillus phage vB_BpsS-140]